MNEVWLRSNPRVPAVILTLGTVDITIGLVLALLANSIGLQVVGGALIVSGLLAVGLSIVQMRRPRLAYKPGQVLFYVGKRRPVAVPVDAVEGFLLGQGPSYLPGQEPAKLETATLVVRLSQRFPEWERVDTNSMVASWCGHYVTLRGTWCERLSLELVNRLNARLAEVAPPRRSLVNS